MAMREDDRCRQRAIGGELAQQLAIGKTHANRSVLGGGTRRTGCALSPVTRQRRSGISSSTPSLMSSFTRTLSYAIKDESATSVFMRAETPRSPPPGTPRRRSSSAFASRDRRSWLGFLFLVMKSLQRLGEPRALADLAALPRWRLQLPGGDLLSLRHAQLAMQRPRLLDRR